MNRVLSSGLFLLLISSFSALASDIEIQRISENSYILTSKNYGTNIGVINAANEIILIDPMPGQKHLETLKNTISSIFAHPIQYVLNTHLHEDHTGGNDYFAGMGAIVSPANMEQKGIQSINVISHSSNDVIFYVPESNVIFTGDVFDSSWHPTFYVGGKEGFSSAMQTILSLGDKDSVIIPGHGKPKTKEELNKFHEDTLAWIDKINQLHSNKLSVEDMMLNSEVLELLNRFNLENEKDFIPEKAFQRFIERTVATLSL